MKLHTDGVRPHVSFGFWYKNICILKASEYNPYVLGSAGIKRLARIIICVWKSLQQQDLFEISRVYKCVKSENKIIRIKTRVILWSTLQMINYIYNNLISQIFNIHYSCCFSRFVNTLIRYQLKKITILFFNIIILLHLQ